MTTPPSHRRIQRCLLFIMLASLVLPSSRPTAAVQAANRPVESMTRNTAIPDRSTPATTWKPQTATNQIRGVAVEPVDTTQPRLLTNPDVIAVAAQRPAQSGTSRWLGRFGDSAASANVIGETTTAPSYALAWAMIPPGSPSFGGTIAPIVNGNRVYTVIAGDYAGGGSWRKLIALDVATGATVWEKALSGSASLHTLTADETHLYFLLDTGATGTVYAVEQATGTTTWSTNIGSALTSQTFNIVIAGTTLFVDVNAQGGDNDLVRLNKQTGQILTPAIPIELYPSESNLIVKDNLFAVGYTTSNKFVRMYHPTTGAQLQQIVASTNEPFALYSHPTLPLVYVVKGNWSYDSLTIYVVRSTDGTILHSRTWNGEILSVNPVATGTTLMLNLCNRTTLAEWCGTDNPSTLLTVDATTLTTMTSQTVPSGAAYTSASMSNGHYYLTHPEYHFGTLPEVLALPLAGGAAWVSRVNRFSGYGAESPAIAANGYMLVANRAILLAYAPGVERPDGHDILDCLCTKAAQHQATASTGTGSQVNTNTGNYSYPAQGLSAPSPDGPLNTDVIYNSGNAYPPVDVQRLANRTSSASPLALSPGWTHSYHT